MNSNRPMIRIIPKISRSISLKKIIILSKQRYYSSRIWLRKPSIIKKRKNLYNFQSSSVNKIALLSKF